MRMERELGAGGPLITGFSGAGFRIGETVFSALLMTVDEAQPWTPPAFDALEIGDLSLLVEAKPEFVLIGTGATLVRPAPALVKTLEDRDIGVEPMDSRAAARAWGVLRGEGRIVAAALYPLDA